jgi:hypothetical protein
MTVSEADIRMTMLEQIITLKTKLDEAETEISDLNDKIHELPRDGDLAIEEAVDWWRSRHMNCGMALATCAGLLALSIVAHIWRSL